MHPNDCIIRVALFMYSVESIVSESNTPPLAHHWLKMVIGLSVEGQNLI